MDSLVISFSSLFIPEEISLHFECDKVEEIGGSIFLVCYEKSDVHHIPKEILKLGKVVQDGYRNKIDIQTYPAKGKEVFIRLYRRKWKLKNPREQDPVKSFSNEYSFTEPGIKATHEFGSFLKGIGR